MAKHTMSDLYQMQSLPLSAKIQMTRRRIQGWIDEFGDDGVYVSFSGGKDSTVLLDLVRKDHPNVEAVYIDTGLEYPEIREFVKTFDNVTILKPKMNFIEVIQKYGYPFISKEVSDRVDGARKYLENLADRQTDRQTDRQIPYSAHMADMLGVDRRKNKNNQNYINLKMGVFPSVDKTQSGWCRYAMVTGELLKEEGTKSDFNCEKYKFFLLDDAPKISSKCCSAMKKAPAHNYTRKTGKKPITAQMASESRLRTSQWLQNGCNGFDMKSPISNPMSFWTNQDVLLYIKMNNLPICSVYGDVVEDTEIKGQMSIFDIEGVADKQLFETEMPTLTTTGCKRTGCMFCGYGAHCKGDTRFVDMKETHPYTYEWIMKSWEEGGLNYKEVIDWINEHGNLNIKY